MTSMIDVVFLLLIFFVCTASFQAIEMVMPSNLLVTGGASIDAAIEPPEQLERILIEIAPAADRATWRVNEQPCTTWGELQELLAAIGSVDASLPVVIDCADEVALAEAIAVYDLCRTLGLAKVQFAAEAD